MLTFTDSEPRVYCDILVDGQVLVAQPGQSYDITDPADGRWEAARSAPEAPVAPPVDAPVSTDPTSN